MENTSEKIRVRGLVQGVGFRPTVWRIAQALRLTGSVQNDNEGVLIRLSGSSEDINQFCSRLEAECPPLARIDIIERETLDSPVAEASFRIIESDSGQVHTGVVPDAATCDDCLEELLNPGNRRYRYPFINCTHCGPRLSIINRIPYDRANTSMASFTLCPACQREYEDPEDRRFHAQPNACPECGPRVWLLDREGMEISPDEFGAEDVPGLASRLLREGRIIAVKGIGGFHLACDALNRDAVETLRARKRRYRKPFALMARNLDVIRRYVEPDLLDERALLSSAAPIVLMKKRDDIKMPESLAPGQASLGFMLPYSPLHHLLMQDWDTPLVMTSGNLSDEPQCFDNQEAGSRLHAIADFLLVHDRAILNRLDDSVVRGMAGKPRLIRRARGYAPASVKLPPGFEQVDGIIALGAELKNTICLIKDGQAILSQHLGDLEDARTSRDYERTLALYEQLYDLQPVQLACDLHPDYRSTRIGRVMAHERGIPLDQVQHHHAHLASVMAENDMPADASPVLGIILDGLGMGQDGTIWGGEFLLGNYRAFERVGHLRTVPMPGGSRSILQPWRSLLAQIYTCFGIREFLQAYPELDVSSFLSEQPLDDYQHMMEQAINSPSSSSCGRLFDSVAAALGLCRDAVTYEGEAAIELETLSLSDQAASDAYPFDVHHHTSMEIDPTPMWHALFNDLGSAVPAAQIGGRFHRGLSRVLVDTASELMQKRGIDTVALSGGVFQNRLLFEDMLDRFQSRGFRVLSHKQVPCNDGGIALGQALVTASRNQ